MENTISNFFLSSLNNQRDNSELGHLITSFLHQQGLNPEQFWSPPVDMVDQDDLIIVYIDIPGIDPTSLHIDFYNNVIEISGDRDKPYATSLRKEIAYGPFTKKITLPLSVTNNNSVKVTSTNGVLIITINKLNEERNRFRVNISDN
jgi:HSP20 family molecular chaperone IbpA